jgi:hypothetical protein
MSAESGVINIASDVLGARFVRADIARTQTVFVKLISLLLERGAITTDDAKALLADVESIAP